MGISSLIRNEKQKFFSAKLSRDKATIIKQTEKLERERMREGELAKLNARRQKAERDVSKIKSYNQKNTPKSKAKRFGQNLANVINKGKTALAEQKQKTGGIDFGGNKARDPFSSSGDSSFSFGPTKKEVKPKSQTITIKINK